jgi:ABC-type transport system involved in cytochrome bd biosynthesis fused ATPase/permease subunit
MARRMAQWLDRNLWIIPLLVFLIAEGVLVGIRAFGTDEPLLASVDPENRKEIYSSLTGSSSGLLGFALAAVAIMAAFGRREASTQETRERENRLAGARTGISKVLLSTSVFLMVILVAATAAIGMDNDKAGSFALTSVITSAAASSLVGLLVSGAGLTLSLMERSRES